MQWPLIRAIRVIRWPFPLADARTGLAAREALNAMEKSPSAQTSRLMDCADDFARRQPTKAVVTAFGAGMLLHMLPLGAITAALVAVAYSLVRPALLFLGLVKACEFLGVSTHTPPSSTTHH